MEAGRVDFLRSSSTKHRSGMACRRVEDPDETIATKCFPQTTEYLSCRYGIQRLRSPLPLVNSQLFYSSLRFQITSRTKYLVRCMERNVAPRAHVIIRKTHTTKVGHHRHHLTEYHSTAIYMLDVFLRGAHSPWDSAPIPGLKAPAHENVPPRQCPECIPAGSIYH